jgi:hypothetical protein
MKDQMKNESVMDTEKKDFEGAGKARRIFSQVRDKLPDAIKERSTASLLIPALAVVGLAILGYRFYNSRRTDQEMSDFAASLDDTSIDHGQVGAA